MEQIDVSPSSSLPTEPAYAGFWRRTVAHLIDSVLLNLLSWVLEIALLGIGYLIASGSLNRPAGPGPLGFLDAYNSIFLQVFNAGLYIVICFPYFVWGHFRYRTTLGKRLVGVEVVRMSDLGPITLNQSIGRWFAYALSYLPLAAGYLMAAFHPEKRALHDLAAGTVSVVVRRNSAVPSR